MEFVYIILHAYLRKYVSTCGHVHRFIYSIHHVMNDVTSNVNDVLIWKFGYLHGCHLILKPRNEWNFMDIPRTQLTSVLGGWLTVHFMGQIFQNLGHLGSIGIYTCVYVY